MTTTGYAGTVYSRHQPRRAHTVTITVEQFVTVAAAAIAGALTSYATARALWK